MAQAKGGRKLRRGPKHKSMYAAQFFRTAKNKAAAQTRIARRKAEKPSPGRKATRLARTSYVRPRPNINTDLQERGES